MKISRNTLVSKVIKENKEAIQVIASLNSHFRIYRNPLLRMLLIPNFTIEEFATNGNCDLELMLNKLYAIGFQIEEIDETIEASKQLLYFESKLDFIEDKVVREIDLTAILAKSEDSLFNVIETALIGLGPDEVLDAQVDLNPMFLTKLFYKMGFNSLTIFNHGIYHIYFKIDLSKTRENNRFCVYRPMDFQQRLMM